MWTDSFLVKKNAKLLQHSGKHQWWKSRTGKLRAAKMDMCKIVMGAGCRKCAVLAVCGSMASCSQTEVGTCALTRLRNKSAASVPQLITMTSSTQPINVKNVLQSKWRFVQDKSVLRSAKLSGWSLFPTFWVVQKRKQGAVSLALNARSVQIDGSMFPKLQKSVLDCSHEQFVAHNFSFQMTIRIPGHSLNKYTLSEPTQITFRPHEIQIAAKSWLLCNKWSLCSSEKGN